MGAKVSVVVPLYNKARHIRRAIDSVLAQEFQDFEVIVIDDGSTDGGGEIVQNMTDPRVRLVVQHNQGVSAARNRGIQEASGDLIAFLDADDEWLPHFLTVVTNLRSQYPQAGIYATAYSIRGKRDFVHPHFADSREGLLEDYFRSAMKAQPVWTSATAIPKGVFDHLGGFLVGVSRGEDTEMWNRIAVHHPVAWCPLESAVYRRDADNRAYRMAKPQVPDLTPIFALELLLESPRPSNSSTGTGHKYLVDWKLRTALRCYERGNKDWAVKLLDTTRGTSLFRLRRFILLLTFRTPLGRLRLAVTTAITFLSYGTGLIRRLSVR